MIFQPDFDLRVRSFCSERNLLSRDETQRRLLLSSGQARISAWNHQINRSSAIFCAISHWPSIVLSIIDQSPSSGQARISAWNHQMDRSNAVLSWEAKWYCYHMPCMREIDETLLGCQSMHWKVSINHSVVGQIIHFNKSLSGSNHWGCCSRLMHWTISCIFLAKMRLW